MVQTMPGGKRDNPGYSQISGYVPKELAIRFKMACAEQETSQSEAIEVALGLWLQSIESKSKR